MNTRTFYVNPEDVKNGELILKNEEFHHIVNVNRMKDGEFLRAIDGKGNDYIARIKDIQSQEKKLLCEVVEKSYTPQESNLYTALAFGVIRGTRSDFLVEKTTEVGVMEIIPMITEHTERKNTNRVERWRKIAISAMKQSGRRYCPCIYPVCEFEDVLRTSERFETKFILDREKGETLKKRPLKGNVLLLIGPEGGFSGLELTRAESYGFKTLSLGRRILRTETAAIAGLTLVLSFAQSTL